MHAPRRSLLSAVVGLAASACGTGSQPASHTGQIIGQNDLEAVEAAQGTPLYDMARSVARVELGNVACTAFRVAPDLFLTNHHCWEGTSCARTRFVLGLERDMPEARRVSLPCTAVVSKSSQLDYALYQVDATAGGGADDYPVATLSSGLPAVGRSLFVAGYPFGYQYKRMDRSDDCKLTGVGAIVSTWLSYTCDTDSGSSGSAVFDRETGHVVGLHWGHSGDTDNNGTEMRSILDDIRANAPAAYARLTIASD
jgi:V8-like Glu-specific endopeptidase